MSYLGDSLRKYWCGPSGHNFTPARRRRDGTEIAAVCLACQKRQFTTTCLFCDAESGTLATVVSPEGGEVQGFVCGLCLADARPSYQGWRTHTIQRVA